MTRRVLVVMLSIMALLLGGSTAEAGKKWCRADPVVAINGHIVDISVYSYLDMQAAATGPVQIVVTLPSGMKGWVLAMDQGFGHGYAVRFATSAKLHATKSAIQIQVAVYAPASDRSLPVIAQLTPIGAGPIAAGTASGNANAWVTIKPR
jgi:hypothetical protein